MWEQNEALECQDCGTELYKLSPVEAQRVAENPYNFVRYCLNCRLDRERQYERLSRLEY